ncbi:uncharacterized protein BKA55DRAFT_207475 [Fusarium redolens]|uniref:Uncharacterized protein n=1 Tax=Fusarium redolens TaxID=48865 RepID=A0A9P9JV53_FUSRE|nr:uncharacterized protein BKA55DRAFT_207475 [Fusarium redolens]KAH7230084.1 hypothetical protein BKA55DRAFT_207475 [Fusarium redolens]
MSEECEKIIARHPTDPYFDLNDTCLNDSQHSEQCLIGMQEWSQPYIKVEAEEAEQRRKRLLFLSHLKECARDPARANGLYTLEGLAQESCIYDIKYPSCNASSISKVPGNSLDERHTLHFRMADRPNAYRIAVQRLMCLVWDCLHLAQPSTLEGCRGRLGDCFCIRANCCSIGCDRCYLCPVVDGLKVAAGHRSSQRSGRSSS